MTRATATAYQYGTLKEVNRVRFPTVLRPSPRLEPGQVTSDKGVRIEALERVQAGTRADSEHGPPALGRLPESEELNRCSVTVCLESLQI